MRSVYALLLVATTALTAQTAPGSNQADQPAPYTLKTGTQRVLVDVIVRDKHGNLVHGLKQSDFAITENKQPQAIRNFDEHTALSPAESAAAPAFPKLPAGEYTNFVPVKQSSALTVILIDRLNTGQRDQQYVRLQLIDYLKHARPDTRTAIYGLTDHLILLQGFTSNPAILLSVLDNKSLSKASPLRDDTIGGGNGVEDLSAVTNTLARDPEFAISFAAAQSFQSQYQSFQSQLQGKYTLDALNQIGRALSGIPGRKNLIWFTGNFPSGLFPGDNNPSVPYGQFAGLEEEFQQTVDLLTASQVAIYPVDAQGVRTNANNNAGLSNPQYGSIHGQQSRSGLGVANDIEAEDAGTAREHIGMDQLAHDTGGDAFYNHNDLSRAVDEAVSSGSNYYTLAYSPAVNDRDAKHDFRAIKVTVNGQDLKLSYRRGYYADPSARKEPSSETASAPQTPPSLKRALLQGGPEPTELLLKVKAAPVNKGFGSTVAEGNTPPDAAALHGPFQDFQVDFATSARQISMRHTSDNRYHADLDFITAVYDARGRLVNAQSSTLRTSYTPEEFLAAFKSGIPFTQLISVPKSGAYTMRVVVHDNLGDKVGAVEIPVDSLRHLPTSTAAALAPTPAPGNDPQQMSPGLRSH